MRIKSYYDSCVATAMRKARQEFDDDVMLVTSRLTTPELRHLGDYEIVFAGEDREPGPVSEGPLQPKPEAMRFQQIVRQQLTPVANRSGGAREAAIDRICTSLGEMVIEPTMAEALTVIIRACAPTRSIPDTHPRSVMVPRILIAPSEAEPACLPAPTEANLVTLAAPQHAEGPGISGLESETAVSALPAPIIVPSGLSAFELADVADEAPCPRAHAGKWFSWIVRASANSGFAMMLIAFGLYGFTRRSG